MDKKKEEEKKITEKDVKYSEDTGNKTTLTLRNIEKRKKKIVKQLRGERETLGKWVEKEIRKERC